ncbi:MAG: capsule biosynthesis GfcC family protein [Aliiglaciecola sp.]|uniref:capsule biosynthesis GfcC family protein n=1 Tax=Aliiglaciecola sp. TaxID=1872441 RepID=UPI0032977E8B
MNRLKSIFKVTLLSLGFSSYVHSQVEVTVDNKVLSFVENPRLSQVLEPIDLKPNWYWRSAQLFKLDSDLAENNKRNLIDQLISVSQSNDSTALTPLISQIESWQLAQRIDIHIDYDLARFVLRYNPLFEDGKYELKLTKRQSSLFIFGAVSQPQTLAYENNQCIETIVAKIDKLEIADANFVYAIQPDGVIRKLPIAYWNQECQQVMPGSQLYIPLAEFQWFSENTQLNQLVAELAVNRIVIE